jgi:hypothetical protein
MKLSRILSVALLGAVAMTSSAMAAGTTAGTKITNQPTLNYSMGNKVIKDTKIESASYVVDKVINLVTARTTDYKQDLAVGESKMVSFTVTNKGNSTENFLLKRFGEKAQFKFSINKFYVDADNSGVIEPKEKVDTKYIKLAKDAKATVFMEVQTDAKTTLKKVNADGLLVQVVDASLKAYTASKTNNISKVDIIFADGDGDGGADAKRDGQYGLYYGWTTVQGGDVKLDVNANPAVVVHDSINGKKNPLAIPGATVVKTWNITNNTTTTAKDVKFIIDIDPKIESIATTNKNVWWAGKKQVHAIWNLNTKKDIGEGVIDNKNNRVIFTISEIKPKETIAPHLITIIK